MGFVVVETAALRKEYGSVVALQGIDLLIEGGGVVGLLGPNGAGKTTLVEILEGLRKPTSGRVTVLGLDPTRESRSLKERIGVQLQSTSLPSALTVAETLDLFAAFYRQTLPPEDILERLDLRSKARHRVETLSGGQRQRLVVGLALIHDPQLVLLDEPTAGLDPTARRSLHSVVRALRDRGRTTIVTTHYIEEAEELCDRVLMIRDGEIVADGSPFELVGRAEGASTIWLAVDGKLDPGPLLAVGATPQGRQAEHLKFSVPDPSAAILALGDMLRSQGLTLIDLRLKRPTLEDVYMECMGEAAVPAVTEPAIATESLAPRVAARTGGERGS